MGQRWRDAVATLFLLSFVAFFIFVIVSGKQA